MSYLPRLDDSSLLADLSAMPDDDTTFMEDPLPPRAAGSGSRDVFSGSAFGSASSSGSGSGSGSHSRSASGSGPASALAPGSGSGSGSGSGGVFGAAWEAPRAKPRFSLFAPQPQVAPVAPRGRPAFALSDDLEEEGDETVMHSQGHEREKEHEYEHEYEHEHGDEQDRAQGEGEGDVDADMEAAQDQDARTETPAARDERLRASLAELKKFNAVFDGFYGALVDARAHNERVAARVAETKALLDKYVAFQGQSLHTRDLILNTRWTGAKDDEAAILAAEHERYLAAERAREAARREAERLEAERLAAEERERERAREAAAAAQRGRGRGRGTSVASVRARTTGIRPPSTGIPTRLTRPTSATGSRPTSAARGRYGHVQSSGYGPPGRRA